MSDVVARVELRGSVVDGAFDGVEVNSRFGDLLLDCLIRSECVTAADLFIGPTDIHLSGLLNRGLALGRVQHPGLIDTLFINTRLVW